MVGLVLTGLCLYNLFLDVVAGWAATATGGFGQGLHVCGFLRLCFQTAS